MALKDYFPTMDIRPNPSCINGLCVEAQRKAETRRNSPEAVAARREAEAAAKAEVAAAAAPLHESNEWGIETVDTEGGGEQQEGAGVASLPLGREPSNTGVNVEGGVDELVKQLNDLYKS